MSRGVSRPRSKGKDLEAYYEAQLSRLAANFAVSADLALVSEHLFCITISSISNRTAVLVYFYTKLYFLSVIRPDLLIISPLI